MTWTGQTTFSAGVLDPRLNSRYDLDAYFQGISKGKNVLSIPHGGLKRRPGMKYHATINGKARLIPFQFNTAQTYAVALQVGRIDIYKAGVLQDSITTGVPWLADELFEIDYAQSADTIILVHENRAPQKLVRTSDTVWTLSAVTFTTIPQFDFNDASSPTPTSEVQDIDFDPDAQNGDTYRLELEGIETDIVTFSSAAADNESRIQSALLDLPNTGEIGIAVAHQGSDVYRITFSGPSAKAWELLASRWVSAADTGTTHNPVTRITVGAPRTEDVWSATRGYPRSVTFHEGRMVFGGSRDRPSTIWMSRTFRPFDFDVAKARDDDAIDFTIETAQVHILNQVVSGRNLQIFARGANFYVPDIPVTPGNMSAPLQTGHGAKQIKPEVIDGATLYAARLGTGIREFLFTDRESAYNAESINIRAPHLFNDVMQIAASEGTDNEDANYLYAVSGDGTMAVFNTLRSEGIAAWTSWETRAGDKIISVITLDNVPWFCVERQINSATVYYLEEASDDHRLDASSLITQASSTTVTGLAHLNGEECRVREGNLILGNETPASGSITVDKAVTNPEVGLDQQPDVDLMPILGKGKRPGQRKRLIRTSMDVKDSAGIFVQNRLQITRAMGQLTSDVPVFTGRHEVRHSGWYPDELVVNFKQTDPLPFEVLGIEVEVG